MEYVPLFLFTLGYFMDCIVHVHFFNGLCAVLIFAGCVDMAHAESQARNYYWDIADDITSVNVGVA